MQVYDWGCAEGEAVHKLSQYLFPAEIRGVDVSETAIRHAKRKYPDYVFESNDWLGNPISAANEIDVIFSSNTLEHFHNPFEILFSQLTTVASKYIILLVPFEENPEQMHEEHFFRFTSQRIPLFRDKWECVFFKVINAGILPDSQWGGCQSLIVYASNDRKAIYKPHVNIDMLQGFLSTSYPSGDSQETKEWPGKITLYSTIEQLREHIKYLTQERDTLSDVTKQQENKIQEQAAQIKAKTHQVEALSARSENQSRQIQEQAAQIKAKRNQVEALSAQTETQVSQIGFYKSALDKIHSHTSEAINTLNVLKTRKGVKIAKLINYVRWNVMKGKFGHRLKSIGRLFRRSASSHASLSQMHFLDGLDESLRTIQYQCLTEVKPKPELVSPEKKSSSNNKVRGDADKPLVSIVLPVCNQADLLADSIDSIICQSYGNWELFIINDGSTDGIEEVFEQYADHSKILLLTQENQQLPKALSNAFQFATGKYVTWTSADNLMGEKQLERFVEFLEANLGSDMVYSDYYAIDDNGDMLIAPEFRPHNRNASDTPEIHLPRDPSPINGYSDNFIGPSFMYRRSAMNIIGDYDPKLGVEDYDYWMRINALLKIEHLGTDELLYYYRVHDNSLNARAKELKIFDAVTELMNYEKQRSEFYGKQVDIVTSSEFASLHSNRFGDVNSIDLSVYDTTGLKSEKRILLLNAEDIYKAGSLAGQFDCICAWFTEKDRNDIYKHQYTINSRVDACFCEDISTSFERLNIIHPTVIDCERKVLLNKVIAFANNRLFYDKTHSREQCETAAPEVFKVSNRKRVLLQIDEYSHGGMEQVLIDLAATLMQTETEVYICICTPPDVRPEQIDDRIKLMYLDPVDKEACYERLLIEHKIDLVNAHYSTFGADICSKLDITFVQTIHNMYFWFDEDQKSSYLRNDANTQAYICVSNNVAWYANEVLHLPEEKTIVINNGVDTDLFRYDPETRQKARSNFGFDEDDYVLLNLASLYAVKGQKHLMEAFVKASNICPNLKLIIAGHIAEPSYYEQMVKMISDEGISDKVIHGKRFDDPVELCHAADALVMPSFWEGCSLAIAEAVAMGLPVLSTRVGDVENQTNMDNCVIYDLPVDMLIDLDKSDIYGLLYKKNKYLTDCIRNGLLTLYHSHKRHVSHSNCKRIDRRLAYRKYGRLFDFILAGGRPDASRKWLRNIR
ncbi:MAG: glycosyltransferase [Planctomycetota bacterium]